MDLASALQTYGYPAVFVGTFLEGETILALGGLAAHRGYLALPWVIAIGAAGAFVGDLACFALGRRYGMRAFARWPNAALAAARVARLLERYDVWVVPGLKFLYGMRLAGAVAIGMTGIGAARFLVLNLAGAIVWAVLVAGAGYAAGQVLEQLLGDLKQIEHMVFAVAAAAGIGAAIAVRIRRHRAARADAARPSVRA